MGDISIIMGIAITLLLMGVFIPYLEAEMGEPSVAYNVSIFEEYDEDINVSQFWWTTSMPGGTTWVAIKGIAKAFFTTWAWFPIWLKAIHYGIRLIGVLLIWRQFRSGGG